MTDATGYLARERLAEFGQTNLALFAEWIRSLSGAKATGGCSEGGVYHVHNLFTTYRSLADAA